MIKRGTNHRDAIILLIIVIGFLFFKNIFSHRPLNEMLSIVEETQNLQVQLHRDLLRYRNNKIYQYDTLNNKIDALNKNIEKLDSYKPILYELHLSEASLLANSIDKQSNLIEDFKTHHSILQNSLLYIFNISGDLYSMYVESTSKESLQIKAELITLLLEFKENTNNSNANKIYPLIDALNVNPDRKTNALINHSLIILERIPEIDSIIAQFNKLNIENEIIFIKNKLNKSIAEQSHKSQIFNVLLFLFTAYLVVYIIYIFINLQRRKKEITSSNEKLSREISLREKTEKALYQLVEIDKNTSNSDADRILYLLKALCDALNVEYAYISQIKSSSMSAEILGLLDHGLFKSNIEYNITNTPCEEAVKNNRMVYNRDFSNYFPACSSGLLQNVESLIATSLTDKKGKVVGVLAIASTSPIADTSLAENILSIIKPRAVLEIDHQIEITNNKRYELGLAFIDEWIARLITEGYEKDIFFMNICRAAQEITRSQLATFPILNKDADTYYFHASTGLDSQIFENMSALLVMTISSHQPSLKTKVDILVIYNLVIVRLQSTSIKPVYNQVF